MVRRRHRQVRSAVVVFVTLMLAAACSQDGPAAPDQPAAPDGDDCQGDVEEGYRPLFDGTQESLDRWRMAGPGGFELQDDCSAVTVGGMGLLWFPEEFGNYRLRLDWRMTGDDNSGVFVGFPDPGTDPWVAVEQGYEIQIDATDAPDRTTGAVYTFQGADAVARDEALRPPGEWNAYEIAVTGQRITVHLNDVLINEFESTDPARDLTTGHIGLQNHGEEDEVYFRNVRIAPFG
ncbi:3-keto-disaccharide hydrolase [Georgenia sp. MJ170]|uniref:3-keto-disaccharide hydrolase n=1 Tax=Georgenia sunbinii TaxID=3117728 RepID=UPI002F25F029